MPWDLWIVFFPCTVNSCDFTIHAQGKKKDWKRKHQIKYNPNGLVSVWIARFAHLVQCFFFFFFSAWTIKSYEFIVQETKIIVHAFKNIKNWSHGTIHTFKIYFATVFSVFSFSKNKFNSNGPLMSLAK